MSDAPPAAAGPTAGMLLRQAREASGLHVAALAVSLKVPVRKLEALEADRHEELPDAVFVRALASSVCRSLKIDPQPVLERLPQTARPRLVPDTEGINTPFRGPSDGPKPGPLDQLSRPVVLTVLALLLGALVVVFLPEGSRSDFRLAPATRSDPVMPPGTPANVAIAPAEPRAPEAVPAPAANGTPAVPMALKPASSTAARAAAPTAAPVAATPPVAVAAPTAAAAVTAAAPVTPAPAASAAAAAASAPAATGIVTFRTRGSSWVQVTDAKGVTVLRKLMEPGESAGASGALPLTVTVGSAEATEVQVRGKPFNLAPLVRDNVARFEVK